MSAWRDTSSITSPCRVGSPHCISSGKALFDPQHYLLEGNGSPASTPAFCFPSLTSPHLSRNKAVIQADYFKRKPPVNMLSHRNTLSLLRLFYLIRALSSLHPLKPLSSSPPSNFSPLIALLGSLRDQPCCHRLGLTFRPPMLIFQKAALMHR